MKSPTQTQKTPYISVVMPAYNAEKYIGEVIATIIEQTFRDFELIILDDGSTDGTPGIIKKYAQLDPRVSYYRQKNHGSKKLGSTLNKAVSFAKAEWIARADSDDPWYLDKLEKQVEFIKSNPDHILIGGAAEVVSERGVFLYSLLGPIDDDDNRRALTLYTSLAHGSVIFRKSIFDKLGGYKDIHAAEDLDLWQRMSTFGKIHNLPEPLFKYRQNTQGISLSNQTAQVKAIEKLGKEFFISKPPRLLSKQELKSKLDAVNSLRGRDIIPDHLVDLLITRIAHDNIAISRLFVKYGNKSDGYKQLVSIALSGRVGFKAVLGTVKSNAVFRVSRLWKKT